MTVLLLATTLLGLWLPGTRPNASLHGQPQWWARLTLMSLIVGWVAAAAGILLACAVAATRLVSGDLGATTTTHLSPGGPLVGAAAAGLGLLAAGRITSWSRRARTARRSARADGWIGQHVQEDDHELVLLPTSRPAAYSVAGHPRQIVVTEGLLELADDRLLAFVIEHERAHLRRHHNRLLLFASATESLFLGLPLVRRSTAVLRLAVERAADEAAAGAERSRREDLAGRLGDLHAVIPCEGASGALPARARSLRAAPPRLEWMQALAATGVIAIAAAAAMVVGHASSYVPALISRLGG
jgi:hypothetical protein